MPRVSEQVEWLSLVDISGPFLVPAVLEQVFPQGLEKVETPRRQRIRSAYEEWRDAVDEDDPQLREMHAAWVLLVLQDMLEYEDAVLVSSQALGGKCLYRAAEHAVEAIPDYAVRGDDGKYRMLICVWPPETDLEKAVSGDPWPASPVERMTLLCRANDVRIGLVTEGERWMVVNAPVGATSGYCAWLARLWWQEPVTLKAFQSLLGVRRSFGPKEETLDALLERSTEFQEEVTDTLGEQVRRAVEILVQSLGRADQDRNGELLKDVRPAELYEAGLTVMMRMVFSLCAEERGLLLLGDPAYDQHYAISTLRSRLREDADRFGAEVLERRHDAWSRMLAVFRAVYGGVEHESLRMPALGGSLFDPDRYPFLEGRAKGTTWRETPSVPLPIDNRTVLLLLDALQVLEQRAGAQLLSYRALDVEQIGHVYEGLLEYTVTKLDKVAVGLIGSQKERHPTITLSELEKLKLQGHEKAVEHLAELTGRSAAAIGKALTRGGDDQTLLQLVHGCGGDEKLARRLQPFADLIRADSWGTRLVYRPGSFAVAQGSDRRETGTHYTPKSLTESIVEKTLEPIVYAGPAEGKPRERWTFRAPAKLLELKVCDLAMGSGAFLVQVCRYLAERLVEAWAHEENKGKAISVDGVVLDALDDAEPMPKSLDERLVIARRLIAERCLYGVDINPLAVELAKLSIWLVTMAKGRPFGFLDHNLRSGDSLLGIHRLDQLTKLAMNPDESGLPQRLFGQNIGKCVTEAVAIRLKLRAIPIRDIRDVEAMARLDSEARKKLEAIELVADAMIGRGLAKCNQPHAISSALDSLAVEAGEYLGGDPEAGKNLAQDTSTDLSVGLLESQLRRSPFHWPIEFPEVFAHGGFDSLLFNPPFRSGSRISTDTSPEYFRFIKAQFQHSKGNTDLCCYFVHRASMLADPTHSTFGFLATNSISQGDNRASTLAPLATSGWKLCAAFPDIQWPGTANIFVSWIVFASQSLSRCQACLSGRPVDAIDTSLSEAVETKDAYRLRSTEGVAYKGVEFLGDGFKIDQAVASLSLPKYGALGVIRPWLNGADITDSPRLARRYAIDFVDMSMTEARKFPECFSIVEREVKPTRADDHRQARRDRWWQYGEKAMGMRAALHGLKRALVRPFTSDTFFFRFVSTEFLFTNALIVVCREDMTTFTILNSSIHEAWARQQGSALKMDFRYTPSKCFATFAFPNLAAASSKSLALNGQALDSCRDEIMAERNEGLTPLYNRFHDQGENSEDIARLRALHVAMDQAVAAAYGWSDLDFDHGFHETRQVVRYTISEPARRAVLERLLALNHRQHEEEVEAGMHDKRMPKTRGRS